MSVCGKDSVAARHVEKSIEKRFAVCGKRLSELSASEVIEMVTTNPEELGSPLWAVLWGLGDAMRWKAVRPWRTRSSGSSTCLEHRLVREHWDALIAGQGREAEIDRQAGEILELKKAMLDQRREYKKLQKANQSLENRVCSLQANCRSNEEH